MTEADHPRPNAELWPENWPAIQLFTRLSTQWRVGMNGPTGLDYNVVFHELDRTGVVGDDYDEMMAAIRVIESTALEEIHQQEAS
ncbi:DUF1799 domain-containing protein [Luteibacter sp. PPL552]